MVAKISLNVGISYEIMRRSPVKVSFVYSLGSCEKEQRLSGCSFCLSDFYLPLGGHVTTLYVQPFRVCRGVLKPSSFASPADG